MSGTYERLTDRGKQLMDFLFNAVIVLGGLALLAWLVSPAR
jgi:hypothetical protein